MRVHALVFVEISATGTAQHAFAVLLLDLAGVLEKTLQAVDQPARGHGIQHHKAIAVFRGKVLIQLGAGSTDSSEVSRRSAWSADAVEHALGGVVDEVAFDAGHQCGHGRNQVLVGEITDAVRSNQGQFSGVESHINVVLGRHSDGLARLSLILHIHNARATCAGVHVRVGNAQLVARLPAALGLEGLVVLTVNGADEYGFFVCNLESLAGQQVGNIEGVSHGVTSFAVSRR